VIGCLNNYTWSTVGVVVTTEETGLRKLTYFIACSIDGFIGGPDGDASFMTRYLDEEYLEFLTSEYPETVPTHGRRSLGVDDLPNKRFDTIVQGRASYDLALKRASPAPTRTCASTSPRARSPGRPTRTSRSSRRTWSAGSES
jgi:hypothetical protein